MEITGKDIERMGLQPGPIYSTLLNKLLYAKLDGKIRNKEEEIKFVKGILIERERNLKE